MKGDLYFKDQHHKSIRDEDLPSESERELRNSFLERLVESLRNSRVREIRSAADDLEPIKAVVIVYLRGLRFDCFPLPSVYLSIFRDPCFQVGFFIRHLYPVLFPFNA
jgi:hypothetical protein